MDVSRMQARGQRADHEERMPRGAATCVILALSGTLWLVIIHLARAVIG